jgi:hypothetical protein
VRRARTLEIVEQGDPRGVPDDPDGEVSERPQGGPDHCLDGTPPASAFNRLSADQSGNTGVKRSMLEARRYSAVPWRPT